MVTALQIAGLCIIAVLFTKLLRQHAPEHGVLLSLLLACGVMTCAMLSLSPLLVQLDRLLSAGGLSSDQIAVLSKAIGISCITQLAADVCKDAGESALATAVMLTGKAALLLLALPSAQMLLTLFQEVLSCVPVLS